MLPDRTPLRPSDADALRAALRAAHRDSGLPVLFGGVVEGDRMRLTEFIGTRTNRLRGVVVTPGAGLGGHVWALGRPAAVPEYVAARQITHDYDPPVVAEGLCSMVAVPVHVRRRPRAVVYASVRQLAPLGGRATEALLRAGRALAAELAVRDEVDRRLAMERALTAAVRPDRAAVAQLEEVRAVHSDLRALSGSITEPAVRDRLLAACDRLAALGGDPELPVAARLSQRERDVLAQVALGCPNPEIARRLSIGAETVKSYLRGAMRKLDAHTRHEAVVRARRAGLLP